MIAETVMPQISNENRNYLQEAFAGCVIYPKEALRQAKAVLTTKELLALLTARDIRKGDIARAMGVHPSRVTEIFKGERRILLDEAAKLVAAFGLESPPVSRPTPVPAPIARILVQYVAAALGLSLEGHQAELAELSEDIRAFAEYVVDPKVRDQPEYAEAFFQAMALRRRTPSPTAPPENGPAPNHH
jgi:transcriptional regulator with XRE-family HTH domain